MSEPWVPFEDRDIFGQPPGPVFASLRLFGDAKGGVHVRGRYLDRNGAWQEACSYIDHASIDATLYGFGLDLEPDETEPAEPRWQGDGVESNDRREG